MFATQNDGVSAQSLQRSLGIASYQAAWAMLHRLRSVLIRPGRERLPGIVEVDETFIGREEPGLRDGRAKGKKSLVAVAVELREPKGYRRCQMTIIPDASGSSLHTMISDHVAAGSQVITDGWQGCRKVDKLGCVNDRCSQRAAKARGDDPAELLPAVHRIASLAKRWLLGTHRGSVDAAHLLRYLAEFVFRFNRRTLRSRGLVFYRVLELAVGHEPVRYHDLIVTTTPAKNPRQHRGASSTRRAWTGPRQRDAGEPSDQVRSAQVDPPNCHHALRSVSPNASMAEMLDHHPTIEMCMTEIVERYRSALGDGMRIPPSRFALPGTLVMAEVERQGSNAFVAYFHGELTVVRSDPKLADALADVASDTTACTYDELVTWASDRGWTVLFRGCHRLASAGELATPELSREANLRWMNRDNNDDLTRIAELIQASAADELANARIDLDSLDPTILCVMDDDERIGAFASMSSWQMDGHFDDLAVFTVDRYRGLGWGSAGVSAIARRSFDLDRIPIYSHASSNIASERLASGVGFVAVTTLLAIGPPAA